MSGIAWAIDVDRKKRLHVGCGTIYLDGWTNVDLPSSESGCALAENNPQGVEKWRTSENDYFGRLKNVSIEKMEDGLPLDHRDLVCDVYGSFDALPCDDGEIEEILTRQVFEHLSVREARGAVLECRRVLCDGGILRLDVPDHEASLNAYAEGINRNFFKRHIFGSRKNTAAYHIVGWTRESLAAFLDEYGFDLVEEEENIHFYPAFCLRFRKRTDMRIDGPPPETDPWFAAWEYCGDEPGEPLIVHGEFKILEIGCGARPWPKASFYVDVEDVRSSLPFEKQESFLQADVHKLPADWTGRFDYVFASHVLEHCRCPHKAAAEMARVARAGCIVCPSPMKDAIFNFHEADHKWWALPTKKKNTIRLMPVDGEWRDRVYEEDVSKAMHQMLRLEKRRFGAEGRLLREWFRRAEPWLDVVVKWNGRLRVEIVK